MLNLYTRQREFFARAYQAPTTPWPSREPTPSVARFARWLERSRPEARILDLGCGQGRHTLLFARLGLRACGVDYTPLALEQAREQARKEQANRPPVFLLADAFALPFRPHSFDALVDYGCFHHVRKRDWPLYLSQILRLLRRGGFFHLSTFSTKFKHFPGERRTRNFVMHRNHYDHFFRKRDFSEIFGRSFSLLAVEEEHHGHEGFWHVLMQMKDAGQ